jgi:branched-chain amino acid transport system permease protein
LNAQAVAQNVLFGLFVGSNYGVAAVGLSLVFGVLKVLNTAHGELLMIGGYLSYWLFTLFGIDPFVSIAITAPVLLVLGLALHRGTFVYVERLDEEPRINTSLLISFGLALIITNLVQLAWSADERSVTTPYAGLGFTIFGVVVPYTRLASFAVALVAIMALEHLLRRTYVGKAIRATAEDWQAAALAGIDVRRTFLLTFGISAALAAIAGALVSVSSSIAPSLGAAWTLKALVVVVLAGMGSIGGAFVAGLVLGVFEALGIYVVGDAYREVIGLVLFLAVLLIRPQGLFGRR